VGGGSPFPDIPSTYRGKLREMFRSEVEKLEDILDRDLSAWK